jgi:membrane-associated phospholipid phosphatase
MNGPATAVVAGLSLKSMNHYRDHSPATTVGWVRVARRFSNVVSPPVIFAVLALALSWYELGFWDGLIWAAVYGFWVSLAPILFVLFLLQTGRISDLHMNTSKERRWPYVASVLGAVIAFLFLLIFDGPNSLHCLAIFSIIELATLSIITNFWMISIHATSIAAATMIVGLVFGLLPALLILPLVILVSWVRLYLRRHTWAQVVAGIILGVASVYVTTLFGCFV